MKQCLIKYLKIKINKSGPSMTYSSPIFLRSSSLYALKIIKSMLSNEHALTIFSVAYGGARSLE
jgi:hypothetical protein